MKQHVLFIHGVGEGAYEEDGLLVASLQNALGPAYEVRYPRMVNEEDPEYGDWKAQITTELAALDGEVVLVGHSIARMTKSYRLPILRSMQQNFIRQQSERSMGVVINLARICLMLPRTS